MSNSIYSIPIHFISNISINPNITYNDNRILLSYPCLSNECGYYSVNLPKGLYKIECWGAQGGNTLPGIGGKGAYTTGLLKLHQDQNLFFYLGNSGEPNGVESFNGGGKGSYVCNDGSGGGATDIRLVDGIWSNFDSLKSRIMVSGGGGGGVRQTTLGNGGSAGIFQGQSGFYGDYLNPTPITLATGGTQTLGGWGGNSSQYPTYSNGTKGGFGIGGYSFDNKWGGGGGGGYYGGGGGATTYHRVGSGAGGSSYISGYEGCKAISYQSTPTSIIHNNNSIHYSGIIFQDPLIIDYTISHPNPTGGFEYGHSGPGFARITVFENRSCISNYNQIVSSYRLILIFFLISCFMTILT